MRPTQITASMRIEDYYGSVWKDIFFSCERRDKYLKSVATSLILNKYCLASSSDSYKLEYMNKIAFVFLLKIAMRIESSKIKWKSPFQAKCNTWKKKKKKKLRQNYWWQKLTFRTACLGYQKRQHNEPNTVNRKRIHRVNTQGVR